MTNENEENLSFRILSAFGILFVVFGHIDAPGLNVAGLVPYYSFHMPLFFFISGYFFKDNKLIDVIKKKFKRLICPFYVWWFVYLVIQTILNSFMGFKLGANFSFFNYLISPLVKCQPYGFCIAGWFIFTLFFVQVLYCLIYKIVNKFFYDFSSDVILSVLLFFISCLSLFLRTYTHNELLINIYKIGATLSFYQSGYIFKKYLNRLYIKINPYLSLSILLLIIILINSIGGMPCPGFYMLSNIDYGFPIIYCTSLLGIMFWYTISLIFSRFNCIYKFLYFIGKRTYFIMINHLFVSFIIQGIVFIINSKYHFLEFSLNGYKTQIYFIANNNNTYKLILALSIIFLCYITCVFQEKVIKPIIANLINEIHNM